MYEDIYNQIKLAAEKKNLKPSTANAYCHTIRHFLDYTGKPWKQKQQSELLSDCCF